MPACDLETSIRIMRNLGLEPDPWQIDVLSSTHPRLLLNCCRQAGKTTVVGVMALLQALFNPMTRVLLVSCSHRQSKEILRQIQLHHRLLGARMLERSTSEVLEFDNLSRIVSMPCKEQTIRGFAHVDLLVIDEAARVPDDLYRAVRPMLAVSKGRLLCLSTPFGRRGFFWEAWAKGGDDWQRFEVPAGKIPRIGEEFLAQERRGLGDSFFRQEFECSFESVEGLVYPDFARCVVPEDSRQWAECRRQWDANLRGWLRRYGKETRYAPDAPWLPPPSSAAVSSGSRQVGAAESELSTADCQPPPADCPLPTADCDCPLPTADCQLTCLGGLDFGYRNPFAALWGFVDRDDVLWLVGEHYARQKPLSHHAKFLPRHVMWYADPSGATEIAELRCADFKVRRGHNAIQAGIGAVAARLASGRLRVLAGRCPNLLYEAALYRWGAPSEVGDRAGAETPLDEHNHALAALRYLVSRLDERKMAREG